MKNIFKYILFIIILNSLEVKTIVYPISITKCGTHLTFKCLNLLRLEKIIIPINYTTLREPEDRIKHINSSINFLKMKGYLFPRHLPNVFPIVHLQHSLNYQKLLESYNILFTIRDPRDRLISGAYWIKNKAIVFPITSTLSIDEIIMGLIDKDFLYYKQQGKNDGAGQYSINNYKSWLGWLKTENVYTIKFENLVGSKGGGNDDLQKQEIENIARHCEIDLRNINITEIARKLFGDEKGTFRSGQIGSWKTHFTKEHKEAFKRNPEACQIIIDLGYEKDNSWLDS